MVQGSGKGVKRYRVWKYFEGIAKMTSHLDVECDKVMDNANRLC